MNEELQRVLVELANQLGTTVPHLWEVMVKQAYIVAAHYLLVFALFVGFGVLLYKYTKSIWDEDIDEGHGIAVSVAWMMDIIVLLILVVESDLLFTALLNPEYWALEQILKALGGGGG